MSRNGSMASRASGPAHGDGSDYAFRMTIEDAYNRIALLKKLSRFGFYSQVVASLLKALWMCIPFLQGSRPAFVVELFVLGELVAVVLWLFGAIGGRRENRAALKFCTVITALMSAQVMLSGFLYHTKSPKATRHPQLLLEYILANDVISEAQSEFVFALLGFVEVVIDTASWLSLMAATFLVFRYVTDVDTLSKAKAGSAPSDKKRR